MPTLSSPAQLDVTSTVIADMSFFKNLFKEVRTITGTPNISSPTSRVLQGNKHAHSQLKRRPRTLGRPANTSLSSEVSRMS